MAQEKLNKLEEKLKQLLTELEGDTGNEDWNALSEKLDKQNAMGSDADFGAILAGVTGEADDADWNSIVDKLDIHDAKVARRKRAAFVSLSVAVIAALIALFTINPFSSNSTNPNKKSTDSNITNQQPNTITENNTDAISSDKNSTGNQNSELTDLDENNNSVNRNSERQGSGDNNNTSTASNRRNNPTGNNNADRTTDNTSGNDNSNSNETTGKTNDKENNNSADKKDNKVTDDDKQTSEDNKDKDKLADNTPIDDGNAIDPQETTSQPPVISAKKGKNELEMNLLRNKITLGFFISPEYVITSFQTGSENSWKVNKSYENINNNQRSNGLGFSTGFSFNYNPFKNLNLSFQTGVKYTENNENVDFDFEVNEVVVEDDIDKKLYYIQLPPGQETQIQRATTNKISYIEVPFMFGYNFNLGEKGKSRWSIAPSIGGSYTKMLSASGVKLNETTLELEQVNYNELNKTNWTMNVSVGVYYQISNRFSVGVLPTYKTYLQTIERGNNYLRNKPYTIGINTGIRFSVF